MAKVTFIERFDYRPTPNTWITYRAGETRDDVPRKAADQAIAEGKAREHKETRRRGKFNGAAEHRFDHDSDGSPGGSLKRAAE